MFTFLRTRAVTGKVAFGFVALSVGAPVVAAQTAIPVPFITTSAGIAAGQVPAGTQCTTGVPVYAVTGTGASYGDGCPATQATFVNPVGIAADKLGNVFIADQGSGVVPFNHQLVRVVYNGGAALAVAIVASNVQNSGLVPQKGYMYTIAGGVTATPVNRFCNQVSGAMGTTNGLDGCPGSQTEQGPRGVAVDADGNVFITSVSPASEVRVFYVGGTAAANLIKLENPTMTGSPQSGYVYLIGGAATGATGYTGDGALATKAEMSTPRGLVVDANENIYVADQLNNVVRRIDGTTGFISTVAGHCVVNGSSCTLTATSGDGSLATSSAVNIYTPYSVALDQYGNLFIAEAGSGANGRVRVVYAGGTLAGVAAPVAGNIYTYAGGGATSGTQALQTAFQLAYGVSVDAAGYLYVTDTRSGATGSNHIWRVDPVNGNAIIWAGTGGSVLANGNHCDRTKQVNLTTPDNLGDTCPSTQGYLSIPQNGIVFDGLGNTYIDDRGDNVIRKLSFNNVYPATAVGSTSVSLPQAFYFATSTTLLTKTATLQGTATTEFTTTSTTATDTCPIGSVLPIAPDTCVSMVAFTPSTAGSRRAVYNYTDATGIVAAEPISGTGVGPVLAIAPGTGASIGTSITPVSVSTDLHGNAYVSDTKGKQVLESTVAGGTGTAVLTGLGSPQQSTIDNYGNLYVVDATSNSLMKLAAGATTTSGTTVLTGLKAPQGVVTDLAANVYVADTGNNRVLFYNPVNGNTTPVSTYPIVLSAPTCLALDAAGNLYIVDTNHTRVVELPVGMTAVQYALPNGVTPAGIAFDAAGDAYLTDTASGNIFFVSSGSFTTSTVAAGLTTPSGVAVGSNGNVFYTDSSASSAVGYNVAVNNSTFGTTNIGLTSLPITLKLTDVGNGAATLATSPYVESGSTSAFPASGTATCIAAFVLVPGGNCTQAFVFSPTTAGPQTANVVFNTTSSQSVTANFSATATNLILTTIAISPLNTTSNYGQTVIYTVTLTPASNGSSAPSGTISFIVDGTTVLSKTVPGAPYTFTLSTTVGMHSVSAVYSGDALYAGSNTTTLLTENKASTAITAGFSQTAAGTVLSAVMTPGSVGALTFTGNILFYLDGNIVATLPVGNGAVSTTVLVADGAHMYYATYTGDTNYASSTSSPVQTLTVARTATAIALTITPVATNGVGGLLLNAKLTAAGAGTPSGTISFSNGLTSLGTVDLSTAINGVVTFTTTSFAYTNPSFTATYSGDGLFDPSTITVSQGTDFIVIPAAGTVGVPQGGQTVDTVVITPINGYTGTLTPRCSGLPQNTVCRFQPTTVALTTTSSISLGVQIFAGINSNTANATFRRFGKTSETFFALLLLAPAFFSLRPRHIGKRGLSSLVVLSVIAMLSVVLTGCGNKVPAYDTGTHLAPTGASTVILTLTDANNVSRSSSISINITQ